MRKIYSYVGSIENLRLVAQGSRRLCVRSPEAITAWVREAAQQPEFDILTVTFVVDERGQLWINDRRSEHVVCANGGSVLTAGELSFFLSDGQVEFYEATNQSTGYCPEPES